MTSDEENWYDNLPEGVQGWNEVKEAESPEAFWEGITNMRGRMGNSITLPGEDASAEARGEFLGKLQKHVPELMLRPTLEDPENMAQVYKMMGMPEDPKEYELPEMDLQGFELPQDRIDAFAQMSHKAGLSKDQFANLVKEYTALDLAGQVAQQQQFQEGVQAVEQSWGAKADENRQTAEAIRKQYFPFIPEEMNGPTLAAFVEIASQLGGESKELLGQQGNPNVLTPETAAMQISEIMGNKEHPYWKPLDPGHAAARKRMRELNQMKVGSSPQ